MLGRVDAEHFPPLHDMTGERPTPIRAQSLDETAQNIRLWQVALAARTP